MEQGQAIEMPAPSIPFRNRKRRSQEASLSSHCATRSHWSVASPASKLRLRWSVDSGNNGLEREIWGFAPTNQRARLALTNQVLHLRGTLKEKRAEVAGKRGRERLRALPLPALRLCRNFRRRWGGEPVHCTDYRGTGIFACSLWRSA